MGLKVNKTKGLSKKGKRDINEDYISFTKKLNNTILDNLFIICDGVGGSNKGDVASKIVSESIKNYFYTNPTKYVDENYIEKSIRYSEYKLSQYSKENRILDMATTLALLYINNEDAIMSWVGDSRIYHISEGKIKHKSEDHSLIQFMINNGDLSEEEAKNHPYKNIISRAIKGIEKTSEIEHKRIHNIKENDYFALVSDGILESVDETSLLKVLNENYNIENAINSIDNLCSTFSKDNYSIILTNIKLHLK